ncbi:uncharacterized protein LOC128277834 [Anopheles cruzii]|uniref:uncharacterized protein LOC128277834 n=1 Tax=Anopheles cruzii TaxID=68878 RepID=UPI0022EC2366|nr:uncharacterized protein LOC128277834 [Anopheles cruzii]
MANDNNNINTDELTQAGSGSSSSGSTGKSSSCTTDGADGPSSVEQPVGTAVQQPASATPEAPRREENPFSFKHFLKWDGGSGSHAATHTANGAGSGSTAAVAQTSINHSRSTSNINGHGSVTGGIAGECRTNDELLGTAGTSCGALSVSASGGQGTAGTGSPSKSATTSSLNVVSSTTTGARPKIPQFQSVNTLSSESKMKRSPRFPSFDSQSSLSDFAAEELRFPRPTGSTGIYQSRSNSSFSADYAPSGPAVPAGGAGRPRDDAAGRTRDVQRSYSHYDMDDSPGSDAVLVDGPEDDGPANSARLVGEAAAEFAAALPDFVQDHLVMEQWYNTHPKGGSRGGGGSRSGGPVGSGSSGSLEFDDMVELAGTLGRPDAPALLNDMPFDLTAGNIGTGGSGAGGRSRGVPVTTPLDLPTSAAAGAGGPELAFDLTQRRRITPTPSADLPPDLTEGGNAELGGGGSVSGSGGNGPYFYSGSGSPPLGVPGTGDSKIHRLPDFLSDGPIHSSGRLADVTHDTPHGTDDRSARHRHQQQQHQRELHFQNRLEMEQMVNERLRRELDNSRRTVGDQGRRIRELERDLETMVTMAAPQHQHPTLASTGGSGSTQSNANSFMLAKSRAATAEAEVERMKQKLTNMGAELEALRRENERLKESGEGAIGGAGAGASALPRDGLDSAASTGNIRGRRHRRQAAEARSARFLRAQTLALRQAAVSAENNLRQLLSGVENLRSMANEIESFSGTTTLHGSGGVEEMARSSMADGSYGRRVVNAVDVEDDGAEVTDGDDDDDDERDALGPAL